MQGSQETDTLRAKAPHWSDSHSQQSLGPAPTIFKLHIHQLQGPGWAFFSTVSYTLATPQLGRGEGLYQPATTLSEMGAYRASLSHHLRL